MSDEIKSPLPRDETMKQRRIETGREFLKREKSRKRLSELALIAADILDDVLGSIVLVDLDQVDWTDKATIQVPIQFRFSTTRSNFARLTELCHERRVVAELRPFSSRSMVLIFTYAEG